MKTTRETDKTLMHLIRRAEKCLRRGYQMPWARETPSGAGNKATVLNLALEMEVDFDSLTDHIVQVATDYVYEM